MCMKNINTDLFFFEEAGGSRVKEDLMNLYGAAKEVAEVDVTENDENTLIIPRISFMLSINATDKGEDNNEQSVINFNKTYRICVRVTETTSGKCVDIVQVDIRPSESEISLCRKIFSRRYMCRVENIVVTRPPVDKDLCVFKVLIQEVSDGTISDEKWIAQSMHPVRMILNK